MKKIILSLIAGTMLSSTAFAMDTVDVSKLALPAEGQVCSDIHDRNTGGINVKELSPYNQCVMVENDINTGFTYKTFWTKVGDKIIPHNVDDLANMNSSERSKMIKETIIKEVIVEKIKEVIIEDTTKIEALEKDIAAKKTSIEFLRNANKSLLGTNADLSSQIETLEGKLSQRTFDLRQAQKQIKDLEAALVDSYTLDDLAAAKLAAFDSFDPNTKGESFKAPTNDQFDIADKKLTYTVSTNFSFSEAKDGPFPGTKTIVLERDDKSYGYRGIGADIDEAINEAIKRATDHFYTNGFEAGYNEGYDDGYSDGYSDGYKDGFNDGVASVK